MYSTADYVKAIVLAIFVILIIAASTWAFTVGPCAAPLNEMPGWCLLLLNR